MAGRGVGDPWDRARIETDLVAIAKTLERQRDELEALQSRLKSPSSSPSHERIKELVMSSLDEAEKRAQSIGHSEIGHDDFLFGLLQARDNGLSSDAREVVKLALEGTGGKRKVSSDDILSALLARGEGVAALQARERELRAVSAHSKGCRPRHRSRPSRFSQHGHES